MLTSEQAIVEYDRGQARPDRLSQLRHGHYLRHVESMLDVYRKGIGVTRQELHRAVASSHLLGARFARVSHRA